MLVRPCAKPYCGTRKQLGVRGDLGVNLQAQNDFPRTSAALNQLGCVRHSVLLAMVGPRRKAPGGKTLASTGKIKLSARRENLLR